MNRQYYGALIHLVGFLTGLLLFLILLTLVMRNQRAGLASLARGARGTCVTCEASGAAGARKTCEGHKGCATGPKENIASCNSPMNPQICPNLHIIHCALEDGPAVGL